MAGYKQIDKDLREFLDDLVETCIKLNDGDGLTRKELCGILSDEYGYDGITDNKLQKIASGSTKLTPDLVCDLSEIYKKPELCNDYCCRICPIGLKYTPKVVIKELPNIVLEMISSLNSVQKSKDELIDIAADGIITPDEYIQFAKIMDDLDRVSLTVKALQLWAEKMKSSGVIDEEELNKLRKK